MSRTLTATKGEMMIRRIVISVVSLLALGTGVAYAATQFASSDGTQVCVNQTNGLMRASETCREGEYAMTIGGGSNVAVTSSGTLTVGLGSTSTPVTLPLTGLTITAACARFNPPPPVPPYSPNAGMTRIVIAAPNGTMNAVASQTAPGNPGPGNVATFGGTSLDVMVTVVLNVGDVRYGTGSTIATANGATATITYGAQISEPATTCKIFWQSTEAPNS